MVSVEPVGLRRSLSVTGGSLLICVIAPEAVYVSADSRYAGARGTLRNSARKLIPWGESALCGLCGLLRFTRTEFDLREDAPASQRTVEIANVISNLEATTGVQAEPALSESLVDSFYRVFAPIWRNSPNISTGLSHGALRLAPLSGWLNSCTQTALPPAMCSCVLSI